MQFVLTLVANPNKLELSGAIVAAAATALDAEGTEPGPPDWLAPDCACDLRFNRPRTQSGLDRVEECVRAALADRPVDHGLQPLAGRRKQLLLADMDATILTGESLDELASQAGLKEEIAAITRRAMLGELEFEAALRARVGKLAGLPVSAVAQTLAGLELTSGARTLIQTMKAAGAHTLLVSGGFHPFAQEVQRLTGFDETHANRLRLRDGRLTGEVEEPILGRGGKIDLLRRTARARGLRADQVLSVGDGANDADMLAAAGLGVAYRGKPGARAAAKVRIDHGDLTALLYLQGYRLAEFRY